jgi:3-oxoacyl-[acyl-carrier protein] reductase
MADDVAAKDLAARYEGLVVQQGNVASTDGCAATVAAAVEAFGALDHVVDCAAIARDAPVARLSDEDWDAVVATNLSGAFRLARAALTYVTASPRGRIVFVSSIAATMGNVGQAPYAASKAGLLGLARTLARELAPHGTTVNLVLPGPTGDTGMTAATEPGFIEAIQRRIPLRRLGRPEEVAHAVRWLLDDLAAFTTGTAVAVDGGLSM